MRKRLLTLVLTGILTLGATVTAFATPITEKENTIGFTEEQWVEKSKKDIVEFNKLHVFSNYNKVYSDILNIKDKSIREDLGSQIAPYWSEVATPYVLDGLKKIEELGNNKNLKTFNNLMIYIQTSNLKKDCDKKFNEPYLLGELDAWGKSGALFTENEKKAIDSINVSWNKITMDNINISQDLIDNVINLDSREWLQTELNKIKEKLKVIPIENERETCKEDMQYFRKKDKETGKVGCIDVNGNWIIKPMFRDIKEFSNGMAFTQDWQTGKWGFIDYTGEWIIEPQYDSQG